MDGRDQQLLDAIVADPEADGPRLVYADYLNAKGDRRGELIAAQVQLEADPDRRDPALARRVAGLISAHRAEVVGDLPLSKPVFRRGFVEAAEITAADFVARGAELFERLPLLRDLVIWLQRDRAPEQLAGSPHFARLRALSLRYGWLDGVELATNPALAGLERLALVECGVGGLALSESPHLDALRELELGLTPVDAPVLQALGRASFADKLRRLRLWKAGLGSQALAELAGFASLEALELGFNELGVADLEPLAGLGASVRRLGLRGNQLGPGLAKALAPFTLFELDLLGARIGDAGVAELSGLDFGELTQLDLEDNRITAAGAKTLARMQLPKLRRLRLRNNDLRRGAKLFANKLRHARVELDDGVLPPDR